MPGHELGEQRFASFILGGECPIELAIDAQQVLEATHISGAIRPLPASADCIEGIMQLREDSIPVVNMKKRLALAETTYAEDAKVAVVQLFNFRCGLLFDDIKDVLQIESGHLQPLHPALCSEDRVVSNLIKLTEDGRTLEVIDLDLIFPSELQAAEQQESVLLETTSSPEVIRTYSRYVVFESAGQQYGVRVEQAQEITFLTDIDDMFRKEAIEGALSLRGKTIPVLSSARLLLQSDTPLQADEDTRILVLTSDELQYGLIVDEVKEIVSVADDAILPLPSGGHPAVAGIVQCDEADDIMLISVDALIETQQDELQSMSRLETNGDSGRLETHQSDTHHLITADCYLIFSLEKNYAIELNDVQEIIEAKDLMTLPGASGLEQKVLNLRGTVIPVVDLGGFFNEATTQGDEKLIIGRKEGRMVALQVNHIETIYKQVQYQNTPSLNPRYQHCADMLDRLIEFVGDSGIREHVLVINIEKLMRDHLGMLSPEPQSASRSAATALPVDPTNPDTENRA